MSTNAALAKYYDTQLQDGLLYQDFVVDVMAEKLALIIQLYASKEYQCQVGESRTGCEIKHDKRYCEPNHNIFIECSERAKRQVGSYVPSGIHRRDNSWLYIVGDYDDIFVFPIKKLRELDLSRHEQIEISGLTSKGFLLYGRDDEPEALSVIHVQPKCKGYMEQLNKDLTRLSDSARLLHQEIKNSLNGQMSLFARKRTW